jgi:hypothetical protein
MVVDVVLDWAKHDSGAWGELLELDLADQRLDGLVGVYIIWRAGLVTEAVKVGQGTIRERIAADRLDPDVVRHRRDHLLVTWARVENRDDRDGITWYLASLLQPLAGESFPLVGAVPVNLPWEEERIPRDDVTLVVPVP